jgi:hypothetical protein
MLRNGFELPLPGLKLKKFKLGTRLMLGLPFCLLGCVSVPENPALQLRPTSEYFDAVEKRTDKEQIYDSFYAVLDVNATLLTSDVLRNQADYNARLYQWSPEQYQNEKSKVESDLAQKTEIFLSFFVPEKRHDDLARPKTVWRIFLDANGTRYEGKAVKVKSILAEIQSLYPHHTRWSTPYRVTFAVPTSLIENTESKLILTGPVGSANLEFRPR